MEVQIVQIGDKIVVIPIKFVDIFKLVESQEFKNYLNEVIYQCGLNTLYEKRVINNKYDFNTLSNKLTILGGESKSIFEYVPDFIAYWTSLKRDEKIDEILKK